MDSTLDFDFEDTNLTRCYVKCVVENHTKRQLENRLLLDHLYCVVCFKIRTKRTKKNEYLQHTFPLVLNHPAIQKYERF